MSSRTKQLVANIRDLAWYPIWSIIWLPVFLVLFPIALICGRWASHRRRRKGLLPRILWAAYALPQTAYMVQADRLAGFSSKMFIWYPSYYNRRNEVSAVWRLILPFAREIVLPRYIFFCWSVVSHDIFHYHFRQRQLTETLLDPFEFALVKSAGKILICSPYGGDAFLQGIKVWDGQDLFQILARDYPSLYARERRVRRSLLAGMRHADWVISVPPHSDIMSRVDELRHCICIDIAEWNYQEKIRQPGPIRIAHSSNHRNIKGTQFVVEACNRLLAEGYLIELDLIEKTPREDARKRYARADIIVEQLIIGVIGMTAVEAMAVGKPVISNVRADVYAMEGWETCPVVSATPATLYEKLKILIADEGKRQALGSQGRDFVCKMYSLDAWARKNGSLYKKLWNRKYATVG